MGFGTKKLLPGLVACICNPATLEAEFRNCVDSIPVGGNSPAKKSFERWANCESTCNSALGEGPA